MTAVGEPYTEGDYSQEYLVLRTRAITQAVQREEVFIEELVDSGRFDLVRSIWERPQENLAPLAATAEGFVDHRNSDISAIDVKGELPLIHDVAMFAGSSLFFRKPTLPLEATPHSLLQQVREMVNLLPNASQYKDLFWILSEIENRIGIADTQRAYTLATLLAGEAPRSSSSQLSLGAGGGDREVLGLNLFPKLLRGNSGVKLNSAFYGTPHVVLVDNVPTLSEIYDRAQDYYAKYLKGPQVKVVGVIQDSSRPATLVLPSHEPFDRATCIRLDPEMIGDVGEFFSGLAAISAPNAEIVISIGKGVEKIDWVKRTQKMREINRYLQEIGLQPTLVRFTAGCSDEGKVHYSGYPEGYANLWMLRCRLGQTA